MVEQDALDPARERLVAEEPAGLVDRGQVLGRDLAAQVRRRGDRPGDERRGHRGLPAGLGRIEAEPVPEPAADAAGAIARRGPPFVEHRDPAAQLSLQPADRHPQAAHLGGERGVGGLVEILIVERLGRRGQQRQGSTRTHVRKITHPARCSLPRPPVS
jgi:hypothetical protein